jgi:hypothetical protein
VEVFTPRSSTAADALADRRHLVALGGRHDRRELLPRHLDATAHGPELFGGRQAVVGAREDAGAHGPEAPDVTGDGPRVDPRDAHDAVALQLVVETALRAEVRHDARGVAHDVAGDPDLRRLLVGVVHARVADVRCGLHHDLAGVAGVGEGLLVAGHAGGEDRLAEGAAAGSVGAALEAAAVFEHEHGGFGGDHVGVPPWGV